MPENSPSHPFFQKTKRNSPLIVVVAVSTTIAFLLGIALADHYVESHMQDFPIECPIE